MNDTLKNTCCLAFYTQVLIYSVIYHELKQSQLIKRTVSMNQCSQKKLLFGGIKGEKCVFEGLIFANFFLTGAKGPHAPSPAPISKVFCFVVGFFFFVFFFQFFWIWSSVLHKLYKFLYKWICNIFLQSISQWPVKKIRQWNDLKVPLLRNGQPMNSGCPDGFTDGLLAILV